MTSLHDHTKPQGSCLISAGALVAFCLILIAPTTAQAAGFAVGEQGAAARGVGGAATARSDFGEAGFYNPAAWGFAEGLSLSAGVSAIVPTITHVHPDSGDQTPATTGLSAPPYASAAYRFGDFAAGVSFNVPFGSGLRWPQDWRGRFDVTAIELQVFEVAGVFAWRPIEDLSVAAGPRLQRSTVAYERQIDAVDTEGSVRLAGDAFGVGAQLAAMYRPNDRLSLGLSWRSRVYHGFSGWADFQDVPVELSEKAHDQYVTTEITLPDRVALGAAWELDRAVASVDVTYWAWSTFDEFAIDFADDATPDVAQPRNWSDTVTLAAGWEQHGWAPDLSVRFGLAFDAAPSPTDTLSPSSPDGNRLVPSVGAGYALTDDLNVDVGYGHVFFLGAEATGEAFPGQYDAGAEVMSLGVTYAP